MSEADRMDIAAFLTARYGEDELLASEATPGPWAPDEPMLTDVVSSALLGAVADCSVGTGYRPQSLEDARHIARWDPARVLADIAAKRRILRLHELCGNGYGPCDEIGVCVPCPTQRLLAAPHAEHPDYDPAWRIQ